MNTNAQMSRQMFAERTVVVSAAANGIGRATALQFAREGANLVLIDLEREGVEATAADARALGVSAQAHTADCTSEEQIQALFRDIGAVDVLVNAVGSSARERSSEFRTSTSDVWRFVYEVTLRSAMLCARQVVPGMCDRRRGNIVNIASDGALRPTAKMAEYAAAKAGVIGFTRALAQELGEFGINVNVVAPGLIQTRTIAQIPESILQSALKDTPLKRVGKPEEVAQAITFLASDRAAYITGQTLAINGGRSFI